MFKLYTFFILPLFIDASKIYVLVHARKNYAPVKIHPNTRFNLTNNLSA